MNRTRLYKASLLLAAAVLFWIVFNVQNSINADRKEFGLTTVEPLQNAPPALAFTTVALGGFRGLIANALWIRASNLQEEDKYFEMVQLADWITKLEPHFIDVWRVQAWNMAYNISIKFKNPDDRWRWVERGIQLIRDDGLRYNPRETQLYNELSIIFAHKMGANLDDAHMTYKLRWAQEMEGVLGGRPDFEALIHPKTPQEKEKVRKLRDVFKMDPELIKKVDDAYGPLDWRLPETHAIYWAEKGRLIAKPKDQEVLRRQIFQCMQLACRRGGMLPPGLKEVTWDSLRFMSPNLELVPKVNNAYLEMINEETNASTLTTFHTGHKNFLKDAVVLLYADGRTNQANYWYKYLGNTYTNAFLGETNNSLDQWAIDQITGLAHETDMDHVTDFLLGMSHTAYLAMIIDDDEKAFSYNALAQKVWNYYESRVKGIPDVRIGLPSLQEIRKRALDNLMKPGSLSPQSLAILRTKLGLPAPTPKPEAPTNAPTEAATGP